MKRARALIAALGAALVCSIANAQTAPVCVVDATTDICLGNAANPFVTTPSAGGTSNVNIARINNITFGAGRQPSIPVTLTSTHTVNVIETQTYTAADGSALPEPGLATNAGIETFNGTNYDRLYGNWQTVELTSAARTIATTGSARTNFNSKQVQCVLNVTVASGTGGLQMVIQGQDSISTNWYNLNNTPTAVTGTGTFVYEVGQNQGVSTGGVTQRTSGMVPRVIRVNVLVGDASSYTYSVSCNFGR